MDPAQRQQGLVDLRQKLVALTAEVVQTEDELAALESDGQLTLGATPASAVQIPRMPAEKNALFLDLFGPRRAVYKELGYSVEMPQTATPIWIGDNPGETGIAK
jgi:hypothetical protein